MREREIHNFYQGVIIVIEKYHGEVKYYDYEEVLSEEMIMNRTQTKVRKKSVENLKNNIDKESSRQKSPDRHRA